MITKQKLKLYLLKYARVNNAGFMNKAIMGTTPKKMGYSALAGAGLGTALASLPGAEAVGQSFRRD